MPVQVREPHHLTEFRRPTKEGVVAQREEMRAERPVGVFGGFKNFLMQGDIIVIAVGLVIALALSTLIKAFTDNVITPLVNSAGSGGTTGLGFHVNGQLVNIGAFIAAVIYFIIFIAVVYFGIVVPYRAYQRRRGVTVFGDPPPAKSCPECLSEDLPVAATKCRYCGSSV
jgi:large conductance mechanosensitive channel